MQSDNNENMIPEDESVVRIVNPKQVYFYLQNGLSPIRLECGYNDKIVYIFMKKPSLLLFHRWREMCKAASPEAQNARA